MWQITLSMNYSMRNTFMFFLSGKILMANTLSWLRFYNCVYIFSRAVKTLEQRDVTQTCTLNRAIKSETWAHTRRLLLLHTYTLTCNMALRPTLPAAHVHMSGWVACNCKHPLHPPHPCPDPSMGWACTFHKHKHTHEVDTAACTMCVGVGQHRVFRGSGGIRLSADLYLKLVWCSYKSSNHLHLNHLLMFSFYS